MDDVSQGEDLDFVEFIVKQIVSNGDDIEVTRQVDEMGVLITLRVSQEDMGRIIGKNGQTAKALRILLRIMGTKTNSRINLKIVEPDGREVRVSEGKFMVE